MTDSKLTHYGVKGMKWGVRRYQNKDGSLTPAGKKRAKSTGDRGELVRKLANRTLNADKKLARLNDQYDRELQELEKTLKEPNSWFDKDGRMTKEASDYMGRFDRVHNKFSSKSSKLHNERNTEEAEARRSIFLADDVKSSVVKARDIHRDLDKLYDETVGHKSKVYQDAFKSYSKKYGDEPDYDVEYGFDHEYWPSSTERKQAVAQYEKQQTTKRKQYNDLITNIGKTVTNGFGDQKISDDSWFKNYEEWGRNEVDEIIRFNRIVLD